MGYSSYLKERFPGIDLEVEDLLLLEAFQIEYLPGRLPEKEFALLLQLHPTVYRFMEAKCPLVGDFISAMLLKHKAGDFKGSPEETCQELLWEIADLIIYNKYPEAYDERSRHTWNIGEITAITSLEGKTVVDAGAGTGNLAFLVAPFAGTVFAVEPVASMRRFMKEKAGRERINNLYVMDGFLDSLPLPGNTVDVLLTSNAIGWNLEDELREIERVLKPRADAIHLVRAHAPTENPFHGILVSEAWNYAFVKSEDGGEHKTIYYKTQIP